MESVLIVTMLFIQRLNTASPTCRASFELYRTKVTSVLRYIFGMFDSVEVNVFDVALPSIHEKLFGVRCQTASSDALDDLLAPLAGLIGTEGAIPEVWKSHTATLLKYAQPARDEDEMSSQVQFAFHYNRLRGMADKLLEDMDRHSYHSGDRALVCERMSQDVITILKMQRLLPAGDSASSVVGHSLYSLLFSFKSKHASHEVSLCSGSFAAITSFALELLETPQPPLHSTGLAVMTLGLAFTTSSNILSVASFAIPKLLNRIGVFSSETDRFVASRCIHAFLVASSPTVEANSLHTKSLLANSTLHYSHAYLQEMCLLILRNREPSAQFFAVFGIRIYITYCSRGRVSSSPSIFRLVISSYYVILNAFFPPLLFLPLLLLLLLVLFSISRRFSVLRCSYRTLLLGVLTCQMAALYEALATASKSSLGAAMGDSKFALGTLVLLMHSWLALLQRVPGTTLRRHILLPNKQLTFCYLFFRFILTEVVEIIFPKVVVEVLKIKLLADRRLEIRSLEKVDTILHFFPLSRSSAFTTQTPIGFGFFAC